jgi:hypothetical protein
VANGTAGRAASVDSPRSGRATGLVWRLKSSDNPELSPTLDSTDFLFLALSSNLAPLDRLLSYLRFIFLSFGHREKAAFRSCFYFPSALLPPSLRDIHPPRCHSSVARSARPGQTPSASSRSTFKMTRHCSVIASLAEALADSLMASVVRAQTLPKMRYVCSLIPVLGRRSY